MRLYNNTYDYFLEGMIEREQECDFEIVPSYLLCKYLK